MSQDLFWLAIALTVVLAVCAGAGWHRRAASILVGLLWLVLAAGVVFGSNQAVAGSDDVTVRGAFLIWLFASVLCFGVVVVLAWALTLVARRVT
jgi:hypothetical protein